MGYDWVEGKSNNAVKCENDGGMTAVKLQKKLKVFFPGVTGKMINECLPPKEKHHSSKFFNLIFYYDWNDIINYFSESENRRSFREKIREEKSEKTETKKLGNCAVKWLVWGSRGYPPVEKTAENCRLLFKGNSVTVFFPDGAKMTKHLGTNGFSFSVKK